MGLGSSGVLQKTGVPGQGFRIEGSGFWGIRASKPKSLTLAGHNIIPEDAGLEIRCSTL